MPSFTYVARRPGPFSALVQAAEIGGLRLDPHPPARALDRYYDTDDGELLRRGLALRVRERAGHVVAALRRVEGEGTLSTDLDLPEAPGDGVLRLPSSALADTVRAAVGDDALRSLLTLRQYRTPRVAYDGEVPVGVISFDVVVYEVPGARVVSNEVEVEPAEGADPLTWLAPVFEARGLERAARSKMARGVIQVPRSLAEPVLLLPDERRGLEDAMGAADVSLRRRAHVVLLDARGFRPDTIASQTGLSMTAVRHWRERFRAVRMGVLDPETAAPARGPLWAPAPGPPALPRIPAPPASVEESAPPAPEAERVPDMEDASDPVPPREVSRAAPTGGPEGDGLSLGSLDTLEDGDMADLLDLFTPSAPDTPLLDDRVDVDDEEAEPPESGGPDIEAPPPAAPPLPAPRRNPYPVVLGPVAAPARKRDPFAEVDLRALRRARRADEPPASAGATPAGPAAPRAALPARPVLSGDTPLLVASEAVVSHAVAAFDDQASQFLRLRVPSEARRLLVAAHGLRLAVETFEAALPERAARRLVTALRPLVAVLDEALEAARAAAVRGGDPDLVRSAAAALAAAAGRLDGTHEGWGDRARRLVARLAAQAADGALRSDDAPLADDFVGAPGDAPSATRLRHVLGSAVWVRFEAVRAFEDDLDLPTPALASHLAVALSGLRYVLGLVEPKGDAADEISAALATAEQTVVDARQRAEVGDDRALDVLTGVWGAATGQAFRSRLAAVVSAV
ncbi:CYTH domain-containing protein [Rubrivirga marina]|uniref:Uncharacterized protein n=1 Tax=Rubrivirga marina TaxID=1196024 RepID=A0A271J274_9BACT|nr:CYTH domain-containing protein [Rubrivirga marina]PAP76809.1 hypothetical protein BSZ37_10375 [Rubrivirga marina]